MAASEQEIRSLQHDIRNLNQTLLTFSGAMGTLQANQKSLNEWVTTLDKSVGELSATVSKVKGGWVVLAALGGIAGGIGSLLTKWFHP